MSEITTRALKLIENYNRESQKETEPKSQKLFEKFSETMKNQFSSFISKMKNFNPNQNSRNHEGKLAPPNISSSTQADLKSLVP